MVRRHVEHVVARLAERRRVVAFPLNSRWASGEVFSTFGLSLSNVTVPD
jgi:hypothetical protein